MRNDCKVVDIYFERDLKNLIVSRHLERSLLISQFAQLIAIIQND